METGDAAQWVESFPSRQEVGPRFNTQHRINQKWQWGNMEVVGSEMQGHPWLHSKWNLMSNKQANKDQTNKDKKTAHIYFGTLETQIKKSHKGWE